MTNNCTHANLSRRKVDIRRDLGNIYVDYTCRDCDTRLTEAFRQSHWMGSDGFETDPPAFDTDQEGDDR